MLKIGLAQNKKANGSGLCTDVVHIIEDTKPHNSNNSNFKIIGSLNQTINQLVFWDKLLSVRHWMVTYFDVFVIL